MQSKYKPQKASTNSLLLGEHQQARRCDAFHPTAKDIELDHLLPIPLKALVGLFSDLAKVGHPVEL
jgi:hypothetical protein